MHIPRAHLKVGDAGIQKRLEKMLVAGRLTDEEAARLRTATTDDERRSIAGAIQLRHARGRIDEAVENGRLTKSEADGFFERLDAGEDPSFLRGLRRRDRAGL